MINKNLFIKIMNSLRDYYDGLSALEKSLGVMFENVWLINILDDILDALFEDMEEDLIDAEAGLIPDDVDPLIYHFAFTCDWGRKEDAHVEIDGKQHSLKSAGDLYDILVKIMEENTNER